MGCHFLPGDLPDRGIEPRSPIFQTLYCLSLKGSSHVVVNTLNKWNILEVISPVVTWTITWTQWQLLPGTMPRKLSLSVCLTLCDPMSCNMPGFSVHHQHLELPQTRIHQVSDAIKSSHPLSPPSPPAFNLSQDQSLFQWGQFFTSGGQTIGASASILPMNIQEWFPLGWTGWISLQSKGL